MENSMNGLETSKKMFSCKLKPTSWWDKMKKKSFKMALVVILFSTFHRKKVEWQEMKSLFVEPN